MSKTLTGRPSQSQNLLHLIQLGLYKLHNYRKIHCVFFSWAPFNEVASSYVIFNMTSTNVYNFVYYSLTWCVIVN